MERRDEVFSAAAFRRWLTSAQPGSRYLYHVGNLAADRSSVTYGGGEVTVRERPEVDAVARLAWDAGREGQVRLFQKRLAPGAMAYYAEKRRRRRG